jgi:UDP-3-O-[3-hydroxymyristoyl] glucosamine N-acyltransferase
MNYTLEQLANIIGAVVNGDASHTVNSLATLENATSTQVAFLSNGKYRQQLIKTKAGVVILHPNALDDCKTNALVVNDPYLAYAKIAQLLDNTPAPAADIHPSAVISTSAVIGENVSIGANAIIEDNAELADNVSIGAGCFIGKNAKVGNATKLWANVSIYHQVIIGEHCLIQANTVIGSDGFGYAPASQDKQQFWHKIPQLGSVIIGNNVEIGASTTVDRGALDNTEIHDGVILDNQIQIAHNVIIGQNTAIAACSVIGGSTVVGKHCIIAGLVGINGHMTIPDGCTLTAMAMVTKSIKEPGIYSSGMPAAPNKDWHKTNARMKKLDSIFSRIKVLEKQLAELKKTQ